MCHGIVERQPNLKKKRVIFFVSTVPADGLAQHLQTQCWPPSGPVYIYIYIYIYIYPGTKRVKMLVSSFGNSHYSDVIMSTMATQITGVFARGIHRWPVDSPHKGPVTWKMFPFDDIIMSRNNTIRFIEISNRLNWCFSNCCNIALEYLGWG